jgi:hypothetical protein
MQCFSCGFNAMPGSAACGRCGANLSLAKAAIPIAPPRAGAVAKRILPGWWALNRRLAPLLLRLGGREAALPALALPMEAVVRPIIAMVLRPVSFLPGVPFLVAGQRAPGWLLLAVWTAVMLLALLSHGLPVICLFLVGGALAIHAASAFQATSLPCRSVGARLAGIITCAVVLVGLFYVPLGWSVMRIVGGSWWLVPVRVPESFPPLAEGDIIWLDRGSRPKPGDLVVTFQPQTLRRVRALEGQAVAMTDGVLHVDGVPSPWQSALRPLAEGVRFVVPEGRCFVLLPESYPPGVPPPAPTPQRTGDWPFNRQPDWTIVVGERDVRDGAAGWLPFAGSLEGRIVGRSYPLSRFGRIE